MESTTTFLADLPRVTVETLLDVLGINAIDVAIDIDAAMYPGPPEHYTCAPDEEIRDAIEEYIWCFFHVRREVSATSKENKDPSIFTGHHTTILLIDIDSGEIYSTNREQSRVGAKLTFHRDEMKLLLERYSCHSYNRYIEQKKLVMPWIYPTLYKVASVVRRYYNPSAIATRILRCNDSGILGSFETKLDIVNAFCYAETPQAIREEVAAALTED